MMGSRMSRWLHDGMLHHDAILHRDAILHYTLMMPCRIIHSIMVHPSLRTCEACAYKSVAMLYNDPHWDIMAYMTQLAWATCFVSSAHSFCEHSPVLIDRAFLQKQPHHVGRLHIVGTPYKKPTRMISAGAMHRWHRHENKGRGMD